MGLIEGDALPVPDFERTIESVPFDDALLQPEGRADADALEEMVMEVDVDADLLSENADEED